MILYRSGDCYYVDKDWDADNFVRYYDTGNHSIFRNKIRPMLTMDDLIISKDCAYVRRFWKVVIGKDLV